MNHIKSLFQFTLFSAAFLLITLTFEKTASAHEYWLEPVKYKVNVGEAIQGQLRNGQDFKGSTFSYISKYIDQFTTQQDGKSEPVTGRDGDLPALNKATTKPGLLSASYQGKFDKITFTDRAKMELYQNYEGLTGLLNRHKERGLADDRFQEFYARCAKALFQVGDVTGDAGETKLTGMKFELVAEKNPYALTQTDMLPVRLFWEGKPMAGTQVRVFQTNTEFQTYPLRTDSEGRVMIPLKGGGKFMLNAVNIYEGDEDPNTETPEWYSYWASMVFGLGDTDAMLASIKTK